MTSATARLPISALLRFLHPLKASATYHGAARQIDGYHLVFDAPSG
jgi:hypothetical protein